MQDQTVTPDVDAEARRNAILLAIASAVGGSAAPIMIGIGGLAGAYLLGPDKSLATLPVSLFVLGSALGAIPAALLMGRVGRRAGFIVGAALGALCGLLSGYFVLAGSFVGFSLSLVLGGVSAAFLAQYRFAAADAGSPAQRAKVISWVLGGGILSAVIGPQTIIYTRDLFAPVPFAGAFFATAVLALVGMLFLLPLTGPARDAPKAVRQSGGRSLGTIVRQPRFIVAVVCAVSSYALMSLVMTAAPLAMVACGLGEDNAALGIQWHVLAMFGPSFFTGSLIARFGKEAIIAAGLLLLAGAGLVALSGLEVFHFWTALILLGVGWNFGFIGATAMLTETYRPEEQSRVQGLNDFILFGFVALASFSSGRLFSTVGWDVINVIVFPVVVVCALALVVAWRNRPQPA